MKKKIFQTKLVSRDNRKCVQVLVFWSPTEINKIMKKNVSNWTALH